MPSTTFHPTASGHDAQIQHRSDGHFDVVVPGHPDIGIEAVWTFDVASLPLALATAHVTGFQQHARIQEIRSQLGLHVELATRCRSEVALAPSDSIRAALLVDLTSEDHRATPKDEAIRIVAARIAEARSRMDRCSLELDALTLSSDRRRDANGYETTIQLSDGPTTIHAGSVEALRDLAYGLLEMDGRDPSDLSPSDVPVVTTAHAAPSPRP